MKPHQLILIEAPTGTGKTNFMTTIPGELIAPLKIIQSQMEEKVGLHNVQTVRGISDQEQQIYFSQFVTRTFASAMERGSINHNFVHIDEFHYLLDYALIDHDAYMAIETKIYQSLEQGKKVVLYSATPEIAILLVQLLGMPIQLHIKIHATENSCSPRSIEFWTNSHPRGNSYFPNTHFMGKVEEELKHSMHKGKFVVLCKTIKTAEQLHSKLKSKFPQLNIELYTSSNPNSKISKSLIQSDKLPNSLNVLITTTILSTGVNIHNKDIYCAICEWPISIVLVQFSARFRANNHHLIVYGSYPQPNSNVQPYNFEQRLGSNFIQNIWIRYKMYSQHLADYYQLNEHQLLISQIQGNSKYSTPFALIEPKKSPLTIHSSELQLNFNWKQELQPQLKIIQQFHKSTTKILVSIPKLINLQFRKQDENWFEQEQTAIKYILQLFKSQSKNEIKVRTKNSNQNQLKYSIANELTSFFGKNLGKEDKLEIIQILNNFGINSKPNKLRKTMEEIGFTTKNKVYNGKRSWTIERN